MPVSVSPSATWLGLLSLIPPAAIFLGTILLGYRQRRLLSLVLLGFGIISVFLGLAQIAQGPSSSLRLFDYTNNTEAVGFFANRNHLAALLYSLTLLAAAWAVSISFGGNDRELGGPRIVALVAIFTALVALTAAQVMARSRAGLGLTIIALFGAFVLAFAGRPKAAFGSQAAQVMGAAVALALLFGVQFALYRILERFALDPIQDGRITFARVTKAAASAFFPIGSGVGSFVPVYAGFEKPPDAFADTYANRAHDDFLEGLLESGVISLVAVALFLVWFGFRAVRAWRRPDASLQHIDKLLPRAATIVIALLLAHSFADYPLRTAAMMGVFAFSCALLVDPTVRSERITQLAFPYAAEAEDGTSVATAMTHARRPAPAIATQTSDVPSKPAGAKPPRRWGADVAWPEEWKKKPKVGADQ
jgi:O-antigen ligase